MSTNTENYEKAYRQGLQAALCLVSKHLEHVPGFDHRNFKNDLEKLINIEEKRFVCDDIVSAWDAKEYMLGFSSPLKALDGTDTLANSRINHLYPLFPDKT